MIRMSRQNIRERYGARVRDQEGRTGWVTRFDGVVEYEYQREMVLVRLDRDNSGQDLYWYDADQLRVSAEGLMGR